MEQPKRPPGDRGQGRKPLSETSETVPFVVRLTVEQREKVRLLGGAAWVRKLIDRAKPPK